MDWATLRAAYKAYFMAAKKQGETQKTVAARCGLNQKDISLLMKNVNQGPQAETFIRAIEGLGLTPAEFFRQLEPGSKPAVPSQAPPPGEALDAHLLVEHPREADADTMHRIGVLFLAASAHARDATPPTRTVRTTRRGKSSKGR